MIHATEPTSVSRTVLAAQQVAKSYGGVYALRDADLTVASGEVHALLGENGAGKSTLVKILTGVHSPDHGKVLIDGEPVSFQSPLHAERLGIHAIHQHLALVRGLSIVDNFLLGRTEAGERARHFGFLSRREAAQVVEQAVASVGLRVDPFTKISQLSLPQAQLVQIARALTAEAKVLVLDEPTAALTPADRDNLFEKLDRLRGDGVGLVYISHRLDEITALCDRATILRDGRIVREMAKDELSVDAMIEAMLDRPVQQLYPPRVASPTEVPVLQVEGLRVTGQPPVSFIVNGGEVVGLTGLVDAGMVPVAEALCGSRRAEAGAVSVDGSTALPRTALDGMRHGIALVPADRSEALIAGLSIAENLALTYSSRAQIASRTGRRLRWMSRRRTKANAVRAIDRFTVDPRRPELSAGSLSGGNQQKIVLAKAVSLSPRVLVLIEPTAGVDVGSRAQIYQLLREIASQGVAVLLVSSDMQEVCGLSDRVCVFRAGAIAKEIPGQTTEREIMGHATRPLAGAR
ncbi:sugar ABC transporter ATP-binding protein [Saccharopolyspora sp. ASAGF58]|nr:sugar ABC transporter ATP-binding protein [Saccharopolyspora sp. ASAGF58]